VGNCIQCVSNTDCVAPNPNCVNGICSP
jgi:hypothetical protein